VTAARRSRASTAAARVARRRSYAFPVGGAASAIVTAGIREGVEPGQAAAYDDPAEALADIREHARPGDVVLFKASRVAGLEALAEALR